MQNRRPNRLRPGKKFRFRSGGGGDAPITAVPSPAEIEVTGNGVVILNNDAIPSSGDFTDFGSVTEGQPAVSRTFTVRNIGGVPLTTSDLSVPTGYTITDVLAATIAPASDDSFTVELATAVAGTKSGNITFSNSDSNENPFTFSITGTVDAIVTSPEIVVTGNGVSIANGDAVPGAGDHTDFGTTTEGGAAVDRTFTVQNTGNANLVTSGMTVPSGYTVVEGLIDILAPSTSDTFTVRLGVATPGTKSGFVTFTTNDADENPFTFAVSGVVTAAPAAPTILTYTVDDETPFEAQSVTHSWTLSGGAITAWSIDSDGDGDADYTGTTETETSYSYPTAGTFTPTLTVTNADGSDSMAGPAIVVSVAPPLSTTFTLTNDGASTTGTNWVTKPFGYQFKSGDIPAGEYPRFRIGGAGADIPYSYWNRANHADGSWRNAGFMLRIPTAILAAGTMSIEITATGTSPGSTSRALSDISAQDFNLAGTGKAGAAAVMWTSSVNQGITDNDDVYEFTDSASGRGGGSVCRYWRIGQGFRNGSTEEEQIYGRYYIFVIENSSGGLYGYRITPEWSNPFGNGFVTVTKPRWVVMERDFGFYNGASPVCMAPLKSAYTFSRKAPVVNSTYFSVDIDYTTKTGPAWALFDTITGQTSGTTASVRWFEETGTDGVLHLAIPAGSGFIDGEVITSGTKSAVCASIARPKVGFLPQTVPDSYKMDYITLSTTGTLPTGLDSTTLYSCSHSMNNFFLSKWGTWHAHNEIALRVSTEDAGTGTHTATPYPGIPRATKLYVLPTDAEELFVAGAGTGADVEVRISHDKDYQRSTGAIPPYPNTVTGTTAQSQKTYQFGQFDAILHEFDERQTGPNRQIGYLHEEAVRDFLLQTKVTRKNLLVLACQFGVRRNHLLDRTSKKQNYIIPNAYAGLGLDFTNYDYGVGQTNVTYGATGWKWGYGYATVSPSADDFYYTGETFQNQNTDHHNNPPYYTALVTGRAEFLDMHIDDVCYNALWSTTTIGGAHLRNWSFPGTGEAIRGFMMWQAFQGRDSAWAFRGLVTAMYLLPQTDPYYDYINDLYDTFFETNFKFKALLPPRYLDTGYPYFFYNGGYIAAPNSSFYYASITVFSHLYIMGIFAWAHKAVPHARSLDAVEQVAKYLPYWKSISIDHMRTAMAVFWFNYYWIYKDGQFGKQPSDDNPLGAIWVAAGASWDGTANTITFPYLNGHASGNTARHIYGMSNGDKISFINAWSHSPPKPGNTSYGLVYYVKNVVQNTTNSFTFQLSPDSSLVDTIDINTTTSGAPYFTGLFALGVNRAGISDLVVIANMNQIVNMIIGAGVLVPSDVLTELDEWAATLPTLYSGRLRFTSQRTSW